MGSRGSIQRSVEINFDFRKWQGRILVTIPYFFAGFCGYAFTLIEHEADYQHAILRAWRKHSQVYVGMSRLVTYHARIFRCS